MPKTTVNKNCYFFLHKDQIGRPGQVASVQPEPITQPVCHTPDLQIRPRIGRPDPAHISAAPLRADLIDHRAKWFYPEPSAKRSYARFSHTNASGLPTGLYPAASA